jgi:prevent-host-death family protein
MGLELSIREAKSRFAEAAAAAARGERVVVTKHGQPFVELVPARPKGGHCFERAAEARERLGLTGVTLTLPDDFDDPAFSRRVLGLED